MATVSRSKPASKKPELKKRGFAPPKEERETFELPMRKTKPSTDLRDYSMLLSGDKKIGKTTLGAQFPDTFFMMTEPGGKSLSIFAKPVKTWKAAKGYLDALEADDASDNRFRYVCVDTADRLANLCEKAVCRRLGIDHPSEEDWGKGWGAVKDEFNAYMNRILALNKGIIFTSHATEKEIRTRTGSITKMVTTLPKWAAEIIEGLVDMWFHYTYDENDRVLIIRGSEGVSAGHRLQHNFRTPAGKEIKVIPMGVSPEQGYQNLLDAFANTFTPSEKADEPPAKKFKTKKTAGAFKVRRAS